MYKPRELFELVENFDELDVDSSYGIGVHDSGEDSYRVYHADGYCFDISKEEECDPDDVYLYCDGVDELQDDGCTYIYTDSWDGFKKIDIDEAIELMKQ